MHTRIHTLNAISYICGTCQFALAAFQYRKMDTIIESFVERRIHDHKMSIRKSIAVEIKDILYIVNEQISIYSKNLLFFTITCHHHTFNAVQCNVCFSALRRYLNHIGTTLR